MRYFKYAELEQLYSNNPRDLLLLPLPQSSLSKSEVLQDSQPGRSLLYDSCHKDLSGTETLHINISLKTSAAWKAVCKAPLVCMNAAEMAI